MTMNRRTFLKRSGQGLAALGLSSLMPLQGFSAEKSNIPGIGVCDWSIGGAANPEILAKVSKANLDGVQVSIGRSPKSIPIRKQEVRQRYLEMEREHDVEISSVAAGAILNANPFFKNPESAIFVVDAIEAAEALGADNILLAFFGAGDLRFRNDSGQLVDLRDDQYSSYKLDRRAVGTVIDVMKQVAHRAEDAGVKIGLENTLTARQNVEIIEEIDSDHVEVYYDMGNSATYGYNVPEEIRYLGNDRICEMHIKDRGRNQDLTKEEGQVPLKEVSKALSDIGFDKWLVLETGGGLNAFKKNGEHARKVFNVG